MAVNNRFNISGRSQNVPVSGIAYMMRYASKYPDCISLGQGTPQFPTPEFIYDYVREKARNDPKVGQYASPALEEELCTLIRKDIKHWYGFEPEPGEVALSVGAAGSLFGAMMALVQKGDEVICFDPSYPIHRSQIVLAEGKIRYIPLLEDLGWRPDIAKLTASINSKTRVIVLTNPNNPTGTVWNAKEIAALVEIIKKNNIILILDEAYRFLDFTNGMKSPVEFPEIRKKILLFKSFSKEYAMTGWRLGYLYGPRELVQHIRINIETYFMISPPTMSIHGAIAALTDLRGQEFMQTMKVQLLSARTTIIDRMQKLTKLFKYIVPDGAFYLFPKLLAFPELSAQQFCEKLVDEARVITIPGDSSGPAGKKHIRMSFATDSVTINRAFDNIDKFAEKYGLLN